MQIEVFSDVVCPWCYLGHRRFTAALEQVGVDPSTVRWRAFQLDPTATAEPQDLKASLEAKYGPGSFDGMTGRLTALGPDVGIDYRFDLAKRVSTRDAHRLIAWSSGQPQGQGPLVDRLFQAYFTEGANIADHAVLADLADGAGYDAPAAAVALAGDDFGAEVDRDLAEARELGVSGVPSFVLSGQYMVSGAQDTETFVRLLGRVLARTA